MKKIKHTYLYLITLFIVGTLADIIIQNGASIVTLTLDKTPLAINILISVGFMLVVTGFTLKFIWHQLRKADNSFQITEKLTYDNIIKLLLTLSIGYVSIIATSALTNFIQTTVHHTVNVPENQKTVESLFHMSTSMMAIMIVLTVIVAPFLEETLFRGIVFAFAKTQKMRYYLIPISGLLFGGFHVMFAFDWIDLLTYSLIGIILATIYAKTKVLQYSIALHMLNNALATYIIFT